MLHVADVSRSIRFYSLLGFELIDVEGAPDCPGWARMHCEGGAISFLEAEDGHKADPAKQGFLLAMYTADLPALREQLAANGLKPPPIHYPDYMPSGALTLSDPDGYIVNINHWSKKEHDDWERGLAEKRAAGRLP
jgi:catechol 2,3-dioxygenase-like lactoylglutathione lyase family enzyme